MYNIRLFKSYSDGIIEKYLTTEHFEIYERDKFVTIIIYNDYGSNDGVQYTVGNVSDECYNSIIVTLNEESIYKYVVK